MVSPVDGGAGHTATPESPATVTEPAPPWKISTAVPSSTAGRVSVTGEAALTSTTAFGVADMVPLVVTVSVGVVAFPLQVDGQRRAWADAVAVADWGLYQAKASGRDCAVVVEGAAAGGRDGVEATLPLCGGTLGITSRSVRASAGKNGNASGMH